MGELIGYARCSTVLQDLTAQRQALAAARGTHQAQRRLCQFRAHCDRRLLPAARPGRVEIDRDDLPRQTPRALEEKARIRWLRAVEQVTSPRERRIALIPYYAGARISEVVCLDTGDVRRSARKGVLHIYGKGDKVRQVPIHAKLRPGLEQWLTERAAWPGAGTSPALAARAAARAIARTTAAAGRCPGNPGDTQN